MEMDTEELIELAKKAGELARKKAWDMGLPYSYGRDGRVFQVYPDGRVTEVIYDGKGNHREVEYSGE